ncbi:MAG: twin-arginine translocation signal domain-containing protein [Planctomycetota bacterium]
MKKGPNRKARGFSRRDFIRTSTAAGVAALTGLLLSKP